MTDELLKNSIEIIVSMAEKYLTEGSEPQLEVLYVINLARFKKYKRKDGQYIRAYLDMYNWRGFRF